MQEVIKDENERSSFLTGRVIGIGVILLMVGLLVIGVFNEITAPADNPFVPQQSFLVFAVLAFLGGLLSFLSPCTLPILPAYFAFATQSGRSQIVTNTVAFMLGVATIFSLFGATASALGSVLRQNQELILIVGGALIVVFGVMSLLGKGFTGMSTNDSVAQRTGPGGSFLFGLTFATGWSSCIGPILGIFLTMAATTASVVQGSILLFIFAMGLGLPLIVVSTFFGRASRNSLIWRILRGRGWFVNVPVLVVAIVWALAVWQIVLAGVGYLFLNVPAFAGQAVTPAHIYGILFLALAGALLWVFTMQGGVSETTELHLHTTSLFSGILFLLMGYFMLSGQMTAITAWATRVAGESEWYIALETWLVGLFS